MKSSLTDNDRSLLKLVVHRWLNLRESTARKSLILKSRSPQRVDELTRESFFRSIDNDTYRPTFLAFEFSDDSDALRIAKRSTVIVLHTLRNLFETELQKSNFSQQDVEAHAKKLYDGLETEDIRLGLCLCQDFGVFAFWSTNPAGTEITTLGISEGIVAIENVDSFWDEEVRTRLRSRNTLDAPSADTTNGTGVAIESHRPPLLHREDAKRQRLREILNDLSKLRLCGPSDDPDEQTSVTESYKYLLTHVKRLSKGIVSAQLCRELDGLSSEAIESIYDVYNSRANLDAIAVEIAYELDHGFAPAESAERHFIAPKLIEDLERLHSVNFDPTKLVGYCREINSSFENENVVACLLLMRTVLNHVPPVFCCATFAQVVAQVGKSLKENLQHLDLGLRKCADLHAHQIIRKRESYPTVNQVEPFRAQFELLLHEVLNKLK